jgi:anti-sigma B factor antagonist
MQIHAEPIDPEKAVLRPAGRMDVESSPAVRQAILDLAGQGILLLVVDLTQVEFMDSSGLSALVSGMKALRKAGGGLGICHANAQIRTAPRLTMLDRVFPIHDTVEQAFEGMANAAPAA